MSAPHWHVFCRVIDNFGDAGVALRFCRQLSLSQAHPVVLLIDDVPLIASLMDEADERAFEVRDWQEHVHISHAASHVISLFGCTIPPHYESLMCKRTPYPHWVNVDHLSAEAWIESFHLKPSPHPPLTEYFFYPGFTPQTGGLIQEDWLRQLYASQQIEKPQGGTNSEPFKVFLFCYQTAPVESLLKAIHYVSIPTHLFIPEDIPHSALIRHLEMTQAPNSSLTITWLPRLKQNVFDQVLAECDLLLVRGEDTWARAQLLGKPLLWHIYPQDEKAHWVKLEAFLERYSLGLPQPLQNLYKRIHSAWNSQQALASEDWYSLLSQWAAFKLHAYEWQQMLLKQPDLVSQLLDFLGKTDKN